MLDVREIRRDPKKYAESLTRKGYDLDVDNFLRLEAERSRLKPATESLQNERNTQSKAIGAAKSRGEDIAPLVAEVGNLGDRLNETKVEFETIQNDLMEILRSVPNVPDASVPPGNSEDDNLEIYSWGEIQERNFEPLDHVDLMADGGLDFEAAAKISEAP